MDSFNLIHNTLTVSKAHNVPITEVILSPTHVQNIVKRFEKPVISFNLNLIKVTEDDHMSDDMMVLRIRGELFYVKLKKETLSSQTALTKRGLTNARANRTLNA